MLKKYVGLDLFDLLIHFGVTVTGCVLLASMAGPDPASQESGIAVGIGLSLVVLAWRRRRALAAAAGYSTGEVHAERIAELEQRVADLEQGHGRVLELEERLDFAERMLARQRDPDPVRLAPGDRG